MNSDAPSYVCERRRSLRSCRHWGLQGCLLHFCHTAGVSWCHHRERKTGCLGFRLGQNYQSGESEETCGRHGSPVSWLQAAHTFCVMCSGHPSVDSKLCLRVPKVEFAYSDQDKLEWGLALKEFLSEIISVSY